VGGGGGSPAARPAPRRADLALPRGRGAGRDGARRVDGPRPPALGARGRWPPSAPSRCSWWTCAS
jgi:hypothetical protein